MSDKWHGGKPTGTVCLRKNGYTVSFSSPKISQFFGVKRYKTMEAAKIAADKFRYEESKKRKTVKNMYRRKIDDDNSPYYEVKTFDNRIFLCDVASLDLVDSRHWAISKDKVPIVFSAATSTHPDRLIFRTAIMGGPCRHLDGDSLNNRRKNLQLYERMERLTFNQQEGWIGGKAAGSISKVNNKYILRFSGPLETFYFPCDNYGDEEAAFIAANDYRYEMSEIRGCIRNKYRYMEDTFGVYLEVMLTNGKTFICDEEDLPLVDAYVWHAKASDKRYYVVSGKDQISFHRVVSNYKVVDHIDGNGLNNRKYNLREGTIENARNYSKRKDNKSGMTGVSFSAAKNAWIVQWSEDGKRRNKSFSVYKARDSETARMMATAYRECLNERLNYHIQQGRLEM